MKIASSALQLESSHTKSRQHEISESLRTWVGNRRPDFEGDGQSVLSQPSATVQISEEAKSAQSREASAIQDSIDAAENDPMLRLLRAMIAMLTDREVDVFDSEELGVDNTYFLTDDADPPPPPPQAGRGGLGKPRSAAR